MTVVSSATKRNFHKLHKNLESHTFTSRANKRDSRKNIIPTEYYTNKTNIQLISNIVEVVKEVPEDTTFDTLILLFLQNKKILSINETGISCDYPFVKTFADSLNFNENLKSIKIPDDEKDPLGLIYQQYITEGEKNKKGSYYTPKKIVSDLLNVKDTKDKTFCDPCCGTGGFLLEAADKFSPDKIFGYDIDSTAVKIARANLFSKYPKINFNQNIQCKNFLLEPIPAYDYFITNPPWGSFTDSNSLPAKSCVKSGEAFSYFLEKALVSIPPEGNINFLLPVSVLNVKIHSDIRNYILSDFQIQQINMYGKCFKGVLTDVISLQISRKFSKNYSYKIKDIKNYTFLCSIKNVLNNPNHNIPLMDEIDSSIIQKIENKAALNLKNASFALGIVTGNNKELIKNQPAPDFQPIITGKEIKKYFVDSPKNYVEYKRENFQQICPDAFFKAKSKFLYKFISNKLVFALDEQQYLTLNSANLMLLPENFELNKYVVLALLNSDLMNFYFQKKINQIKILKNDIKSLPLPFMSNDVQNAISEFLLKAIKNKETHSDELENFLFDFYELEKEEIIRIKQSLN